MQEDIEQDAGLVRHQRGLALEHDIASIERERACVADISMLRATGVERYSRRELCQRSTRGHEAREESRENDLRYPAHLDLLAAKTKTPCVP
jgi:hypothetical protein